ncbi:hypothetical protein J437_LFUL002053 [Ladona fulva]|uniref:CCHC-type domain-containing protein n=1 Tax=Ladona fulva TaxID=123851 RepID=A0A8K0JUV8_LADFU|nr:hypothetical protein J437_LFUL002053 [Ladona fulva]
MSEPPTNAGKSPATSPRAVKKDCPGAEKMKPPSSTPSTINANHPSTSTTSSLITASSPITTTSSPITTSSSSNTTSTPSSYAAATRSNATGTTTPAETFAGQSDADKQTAVVADALEGLALEDYLVALTTLVDPRDINFASRISLGRMCIYLRTREMAERVAASTGIPQKGKIIKFRKYVLGCTRIFLSNAIPDIPGKSIHEHLSKFGRVVGPINFCRANCSNPLFAHVRGFRRVAHVVVENLAVLPIAIPITHGGTTHTVFLNLEDHTCTNCGKRGHHEARCSAKIQPSAEPVPTPTTERDEAPAETVKETAKEQEEATKGVPEKAYPPSGPAEVEAEPVAMEVGTVVGQKRPKKREAESPEKTVTKRSATGTPAPETDDGEDTCSVESEDPPSSSTAGDGIPNQLFRRAVREPWRQEKAADYLRELPGAFLEMIRAIQEAKTGKERQNKQGKRIANLIARLTEELRL